MQRVNILQNLRKRVIVSPHPGIPTPGRINCTIPEILRSRASLNNGDKIIYESSIARYTFDDVLKNCRRFAKSLLMPRSLQRGDVVAIILPNIPEFTTALFGIWEAGLVATTVNPNSTAGEIERQMLMCKPKCYITTSEYLPMIQKIATTVSPKVNFIVNIGEPHSGSHSFSEMIKFENRSDKIKLLEHPTENDTALILFSSGTTGQPKAVMLNHENVCANFLQVSTPGVFNINSNTDSEASQEKCLGVLPFFHGFGIVAYTYLSMCYSIRTLCLPKYNFDTFLQAIRDFKPTVLQTVGPIYERMSVDNKCSTRDLDSIHTMITGATTINTTAALKLLEKAGNNLFIQNSFGMTEVGHCTTLLPNYENNAKMKSVGNLLPGIKAKVIDVDSKVVLGPFEQGEILIQGPQTFQGYLNNSEATKNDIFEENWVKTGDLGYYDEDGCLYVVDRLKDIMKIKGFQVSPAELESYLKTNPEIYDACVIGIPDDRCGQVPRAYIVKNPGGSITTNDVHSFLKNKLSSYKQLKGGIEFVKELPKGASGKILRRMVLQEYLRQQIISAQ